MEKDTLIKYAPIAVIVIAMIMQWNLFVRPEQQEALHREILIEVSNKYMTKEQANDMKVQLKDIQNKVDKIYDKVIGVR